MRHRARPARRQSVDKDDSAVIYPYLPYAITELFCIVFAIAILFRMNGSIGSQHEIAQLKRMVYTFIVMVAGDIFWALNCDGIIVLDRLVNAVDSAITIMAITLGCFLVPLRGRPPA